MKAMKINILYPILMIAFILSSCGNTKKDATNEYTMNVDVAMPTTDSVLLRKSYPASLKAKSVVNLVARVDGYLQSVNYKAGQYVKKGQLLFVIEPKTYQEAVSQAEAQLASATSQYEYAKTNYESMKEAAASNAVSKIDYVQAESNLNQSSAAIKSAKASLENAKLNLSYCYIKAPSSGHITKNTVDVGNYLNGAASPQTLATIYDDQTMSVNFTIEDSQYMRMVSDQKSVDAKKSFNVVELIFNEKLPHSYTAVIDYLSPMVDLSTGTVSLRAKVENPYGELKSGMYCIVSLPYKELSKAILVKDAAISTDQLGKFVYTVNDSNQVVYTPIKVGDLVNDTLRIVTDGLAPNQKYVTQAIQKVRDGMKVNPVLKK